MIRIFAFDDSLERLTSLKALISLSDNLEYVGVFYPHFFRPQLVVS